MILDLFAGPGGWSTGLSMLGITDEVGIEWDEDACLTRTAAGYRTIRADVASYPTEPFRGMVDGLIASPPCQAFSLAGKGAGRREIDLVHAAVELCRHGWTDAAIAGPWEDARTPLILQPLRWAWALRPRWIALEQVPPALGVWQHMADVLRSWRYSADARILCAADYGVPQTRRRAILVAHVDGVRWPEPTHAAKPAPSLFGASRLPWVTMAEALGWTEGTVDCNTPYQAAPTFDAAARPSRVITHKAREWRLDRRQTGAPEVDPSTAPCPTIVGSALANGVWQMRASNRPNACRRSTHEPAPTLVFGHASNEVDWVPDADARVSRDGRRIEVEEASTLQGFPADYPWQGSRSSRFLQIGNAVPPPLAAAIICALTQRH